MSLFTSTRIVEEQGTPTAIFESMGEINRICNDIALSQPALEALVELPELATQFDVVNTAPSVAMLEFVAKQKLATIGIEIYGVAQEGVIEGVKNAAVSAWKWLVGILTKIEDWILSFFNSKPAERVEAAIKEAEVAMETPPTHTDASGAQGPLSEPVAQRSEPTPEDHSKHRAALARLRALCRVYAGVENKYKNVGMLVAKIANLTLKAEYEHTPVRGGEQKKRHDSIIAAGFIQTDVHCVGVCMVALNKIAAKIIKYAGYLKGSTASTPLIGCGLNGLISDLSEVLKKLEDVLDIEANLQSKIKLMEGLLSNKSVLDTEQLDSLATDKGRSQSMASTLVISMSLLDEHTHHFKMALHLMQ